MNLNDPKFFVGQRKPRQVLSVVLFILLTVPCTVAGDAIVITKAMSASTIAEVFVDQDVVRIQLEIGAADIDAFKDLLPEDIYQKFKLPDARSQADRLKDFFTTGLVISSNGTTLPGQLNSLTARKRIKRDEITGDPLGAQPADAEVVIYAQLQYKFDGRPQSISIKPPTVYAKGRSAANIGFVAYHRGLPVSNFRYLSTTETLDLDWGDPWYSKFRNKNLRRQYDSPINVFLYIEPFEVRKEIVIRPADLQRWVDLGIDVNSTIPIAAQAELKQRVAEFVKDKHPVKVDGKTVAGNVDRIHFIRRTLRKTGVVYPAEEQPAVSATLGIIVVYPIETLPQEVTMKWEWFDDKIKQIPASATDEAGGLPWTITPDDPVLVWKNFLTNPTIPAMRSVPPPAVRSKITLPLISIVCLLISLIAIFRLAASKTNRRPAAYALVASVVVAGLAFPFARVTWDNPLEKPAQISDQQADQIIDSLLHNLYHAFDRREEELVYDQLAISLSGDLLTDIYLQTQSQIQLAAQGGAQVKVDQVEIQNNEIEATDDQSFSCLCSWKVSGTVGHWGHLHRRLMGYEAKFKIEPVDRVWKITSMQITEEAEPETQVRAP